MYMELWIGEKDVFTLGDRYIGSDTVHELINKIKREHSSGYIKVEFNKKLDYDVVEKADEPKGKIHEYLLA